MARLPRAAIIRRREPVRVHMCLRAIDEVGVLRGDADQPVSERSRTKLKIVRRGSAALPSGAVWPVRVKRHCTRA